MRTIKKTLARHTSPLTISGRQSRHPLYKVPEQCNVPELQNQTLILSAAVYGLLTHSFNFSLILIGAFLTSNLCNEQKNISHRTLREILDYKTKLTPDSMHRSVVLTAHSSTPARRILKRLSYNNYHIVHVTDDNMRVIRTLTEGQLLNALTENGIRVLLSDIK